MERKARGLRISVSSALCCLTSVRHSPFSDSNRRKRKWLLKRLALGRGQGSASPARAMVWEGPALIGGNGKLHRCCATLAVDLADYGLALPSQSQTRTTPAELLKVRHRLLSGRSWLPRGQGCEGKIVHGGLYSRYWPLQSPVSKCEQADCPEHR